MANGTPDTSGRRVLRILHYLAQHQKPVLASAIARDCAFPRSSTYRLLHVMAEERFVTYYPDEGRWGLGLAAYELGTGYLLSDPLARQAAGILVRLAAETGAYTAIGVLDGTDVVVSRSQIPEAATAWADVHSGVRYPAQRTAMGRAILLGRDERELDALYGEHGLAPLEVNGEAGGRALALEKLMDDLREAEAVGYTASLNDLDDGITGYAAPVHSAVGRVVAALAVGFLEDAPSGAELERVLVALRAGASELSARLGYRATEGAHNGTKAGR
jgi:DNA-binding IclR family transcriptional regulator